MNVGSVILIFAGGAVFGVGAVLFFFMPRYLRLKDDLKLARSCIRQWKEYRPYENEGAGGKR